MITSDEQISPPSLICKQNSSHLHSLGVNILFNCSALGIHSCKTWQTFIFKTRLGGEICSSDVDMYKDHNHRESFSATIKAWEEEDTIATCYVNWNEYDEF